MTGVPEGYVGFVYSITRLHDGRKYLGQKQFYKAVTKPPLKGKTRKRRSRVESDWRDYFGSNAELQASVAELGPDAFRREIIALCEGKAIMNYMESKAIFEADALLRDDYFNAWVSVRINRNQLRN